MTENENNGCSLVSIIKVEQDEFQITVADESKRPSSDSIKVSRTAFISESIVPLEPNRLEKPPKYARRYERGSEAVDAFLRKGNEGLNNSDPHRCCFCQKIYSNRTGYRRHLENTHCKTKKWICDLCPKFYFTKHALYLHMRTHLTKDLFCDVCDYRTSVKLCLDSHKLSHATRVECPICHKQVTSIKVHMIEHGPKVLCPICQRMIIKPSIKKHIKEHKIQKCDKCDEVFVNMTDRARHKMRKHYDGKLFECHCGSLYKTANLLEKHQQSHVEKKVPCSICQRKFKTENDLILHCSKLHSNQPQRNFAPKVENFREKAKVLKRTGPYICDKCGLHFSTRDYISAHFRSQQCVVMFCDLCPQYFGRKTFLLNHMRSDHLGVRLFNCKLCNYRGSYKIGLRNHMLRHGSKTKCKICKKQVLHMRLHLKNHVKVECPICKKLRTKKNLRRHIEVHEKNKSK